MTLASAVEAYVSRRRSEGSPFVSSEATLRSFGKWCGNIQLSDLTVNKIDTFLNSKRCTGVTRLSKFSGIKCFVNHWSLRGQMAALALEKPPRPQSVLAPFVFSRRQVKSLLHSEESCPKTEHSIARVAVRMVMLTLYATGCRVNEVFELRRSDVDLKRKQIRFRSHGIRSGRCIPIGPELRATFMQYDSTRPSAKTTDAFLFLDRDGTRIKRGKVYKHFGDLLAEAGVHKRDGRRDPHLQDLRFSFAVHRIAQCIREADDLNRLLPALSTYMGYANLTKSEEFLAHVPERFRGDLHKLSPQKGRRRWSNDPSLMRYLGRI
jgi:integrase/recombinase XerD